MAPEHRFATAARLCSEVLAGFADGALPLDGAAEVLRDALHALASKDIKVPADVTTLSNSGAPPHGVSDDSAPLRWHAAAVVHCRAHLRLMQQLPLSSWG